MAGKITIPTPFLSNAEMQLRALCKECLKLRELKFFPVNAFFSFGVRTGYFVSRLMSSWGIAGDFRYGLGMMKTLLSSVNQKNLNDKIKAGQLKGKGLLPPWCYTSHLLSLTPKLHSHCVLLVVVCSLLIWSRLCTLLKQEAILCKKHLMYPDPTRQNCQYIPWRMPFLKNNTPCLTSVNECNLFSSS